MSNLSIKDVPEAWAQALRQRAARNHRSLQGELMAIIEHAVNDAPAPAACPTSPPSASTAPVGYDPRGTAVGHDRFGYPIIRNGWKTFEQWVAQRRQMYPEPVLGFPSGTDLIREDRDSR